MNALELADCLDVESSQAEYGYVVDDWKLFNDAAVMLRQQQTEIEKLKDEVAMWKMSYENSIRFEAGYGHN